MFLTKENYNLIDYTNLIVKNAVNINHLIKLYAKKILNS